MSNPNAVAPEAGKFKKGQSGNPGGRQKALREVEELARKYSVKAIEGLVEIAENANAAAAARIAAWNAILDRAVGKPKQAVEVSGEDGEPIAVEVIRRIIVDPKQGR